MSTEFARLFKAQTGVSSGRFVHNRISSLCPDVQAAVRRSKVLAEIAAKMVYRQTVLEK
jgi:hypothetical protein